MDKKKKPSSLTALTFPNIFARTGDGQGPGSGEVSPTAADVARTPPPAETPSALADPPRLSGRGRSSARARPAWPAEPGGPRAGSPGARAGSPGDSPLASPGRFIMEGTILRGETSPGREPAAAAPPPPLLPPLDGWMARTLTQAHVCDTRRDRGGDTPLLRAARSADFVALVDMLGYPGTNIHFRDGDGRCAYDLLKKSMADHESPEFRVVGQALFLRTLLSLMIREERYAGLVGGAAAGATPRQLAEKVYARLAATYQGQPDDRALPFAALPSVDFIEAIIRLM